MEKLGVIAGNFAPHFLGFQVNISVSISVKSRGHYHVYILFAEFEFSPL